MPRAFPQRSLPTEITPKLAYSLSVGPVSPDFLDRIGAPASRKLTVPVIILRSVRRTI